MSKVKNSQIVPSQSTEPKVQAEAVTKAPEAASSVTTPKEASAGTPTPEEPENKPSSPVDTEVDGSSEAEVQEDEETFEEAGEEPSDPPPTDRRVKKWSLKASDVTISKPDELDLRTVTVKCQGNKHSSLLDATDEEKVIEFAKSIVEEESLSEDLAADFIDKLPQVLNAKLEELTMPTAGQARKIVETFLKSAGEDATTSVASGVKNKALLKALSVLNEEPSGEFEEFFHELSVRKVKDKQLAPLRAAVKRVATQTKKLIQRQKGQGGGALVTYTVGEEGFTAHFPGDDGGTRLLSNFTAKILEDVNEDDGAEVRRIFKLQGHLNGEEHVFALPASDFASMKWPLIHMGAKATIYPSGSNTEHVRAAVQANSQDAVRRKIYTHTGWAVIGEDYVYLHAGGALGEAGPVEGVEVELRGELARYHLPPPPDDIEEQRAAVRRTLELRTLAPLPVTCCLEGATFRAALGGDCDTTVWVCGQTGNGKSELAARYQQHYGKGFERMALPGNWASTGNSLEAAAHAAKDAIFVIDDFCPRGAPNDVSRYNQTADRLIRALRNQQGRQRLTADGKLRTTKTPRCVAVCTGEDVPEGHSLRASMMIVELGPNELKFDDLAGFQRSGADGVFSVTMAGFVKWLACCYPERMKELPDKMAEYRAKAAESGTHKRTPELVANLMVGVEYFLAYALDIQAIDQKEHDRLFEEAWTAIGEAAAGQSDYLADADSARRFITLLRSALMSGKAYLEECHGLRPGEDELARLVGWKLEPEGGGSSTWKHQGKLIGWTEKDDVYLEPTAAYQLAQDVARGSSSIPVQLKTLNKRLRDAGLLATTDEQRNRVVVRKKICNARREVLHLKLETLLGEVSDLLRRQLVENTAAEEENEAAAEIDEGGDEGTEEAAVVKDGEGAEPQEVTPEAKSTAVAVKAAKPKRQFLDQD